jgi:hypothetical protein
MSFPAGSAIGDLAVVFCEKQYPVDTPSGWTSIYLNGYRMAAYKVLTSGDIATGTVTVQATAPYLGTNANITGGLVVFVGAGGGVREYEVAVAASGFGATLTNTTSGAVLSTDTAIYWASTIGASAFPTITPASGSANTLQSASSSGIYSVLADQLMPGGALAVANLFGNGDYVAIQVIVEIGLAPPSGLIPVNMNGGMRDMCGGKNG